MTGRPVISSCSLAKAIAEPENETRADDDAEDDLEDLVGRDGAGPPNGDADPAKPVRADVRDAVREMNPVIETSAAAPPPTPLKIATSCGIAVIFTNRDVGTAMAAPTRHRPDHPAEVVEARAGERGTDRERHARDGDEVAPAGVLRAGEALRARR